VLGPEVAQIESHDYWYLALDGGSQYMTILFIIRHPRNQGP